MVSGVSRNPPSYFPVVFFSDRVWPDCRCFLHSYRAILYCGAFHRMHRLLRGSGALRRGEMDVLTGSLDGKHDREGTLEAASVGLKK